MVRSAVVHLLLFIAAVSVATLAAGLLVTESTQYAQSIEGEADGDVGEIDAEIAIVSDSEAGAIYDDSGDEGTVTLYVKNVGGEALEPTTVDLLVNGVYAADPDATVLAEHDRWRAGTVLELADERSLDPGEHRVQVSIDGAQDHLAFEHRIARWVSPAETNDQIDEADCDEDGCTVYQDEFDDDEVSLGMETEQPQPGSVIEYASADASVATIDPAEGTTDDDGTDGTTLHLQETGTTSVTLDAGWDDGAIEITIAESRD